MMNLNLNDRMLNPATQTHIGPFAGQIPNLAPDNGVNAPALQNSIACTSWGRRDNLALCILDHRVMRSRPYGDFAYDRVWREGA
jgi:hypothetical protein